MEAIAADSTSRSSPIRTYSIAVLLIAAGVGVFVAYVDAIMHSSLTKAGDQIRTSAWALVAFFDASFGAVFAVYYVFVRHGPSVFGIRSSVFAFVWPFTANFALVWYVAYMIVREKQLSLALLPHSQQELLGDDVDVSMRTEQKRATSQIAIAFGTVAIAAVGALSVWAFRKESMRAVLNVVASEQYKWVTFTFVDSIAGLLFVAVYIVEREGGVSISSTLWVVAVLLIGNMVTFAYVILMALEALRLHVPLWHVVLSTRKSLLSREGGAYV